LKLKSVSSKNSEDKPKTKTNKTKSASQD